MVRVGSSRGFVGRLRSETKGLRVRVKITGSGVRALESVVSALGRCQGGGIGSSGVGMEWVGTQGCTLPWRQENE